MTYPVVDGIVDFCPDVKDTVSKAYNACSSLYDAYMASGLSPGMFRRMFDRLVWGETRKRSEFLPSRELSGRSEAIASSPDQYSTSSEKSVVKHSIDEFLYSLVAWFLLLMTGLLTLTFVDLSVHGSKNHAVGFPRTVMEWTEIGSYRDGQFYPSSILINVAVGVMFSAAIAFLLALNRYRSNSSWRHKE